MRYYKDLDNKLHALDSSEFEYLLPVGCIEITEQEAIGLAPQPTIADKRASMVLTPAQARVKLANLGMLTGIDIAISALPIDNLTRIYWDYATEFRRNDLTLNEFCVNNLGMSPEQIDTLFVN